ncbi:MAG: CHAT domain-containing protein [Rhizonema sp. NSF051]|nr:CHAT domain-containing protein [Rhizonema sp. NSF051]
MKKILILSANSKGTTSLRLDEEVREINAGLERAQHRSRFVLEQKWAVRPRDISRAMLDLNPQIVHFSGHGTRDEGLVFEDETGSAKLVDGEALAGLFDLFAEQVECVVLNGCYSEVQASVIAEHINYVIGMKKAIGDRAAIEFAVGFYDALGAGRSVEFAHKFGCAAIRLAGIPEQLTPVLKKNLKCRKLIIDHKPLEDSLLSCDTSIVSRNQVLSQNQIQAIEIYRQLVEELVRKDGVICSIKRSILKEYIKNLGVPPEEAFRIEDEVLKPYVDYSQNLQKYQHRFGDMCLLGSSLTIKS